MGIEFDEEATRTLEDAAGAEVKRRMADAVETVLAELSGCGDPERVTDALVEAMRARGLKVTTPEHRANVRAQFGDPIADGDVPSDR